MPQRALALKTGTEHEIDWVISGSNKRQGKSGM
jgi:hypothetical protein